MTKNRLRQVEESLCTVERCSILSQEILEQVRVAHELLADSKRLLNEQPAPAPDNAAAPVNISDSVMLLDQLAEVLIRARALADLGEFDVTKGLVEAALIDVGRRLARATALPNDALLH